MASFFTSKNVVGLPKIEPRGIVGVLGQVQLGHELLHRLEPQGPRFWLVAKQCGGAAQREQRGHNVDTTWTCETNPIGTMKSDFRKARENSMGKSMENMNMMRKWMEDYGKAIGHDGHHGYIYIYICDWK